MSKTCDKDVSDDEYQDAIGSNFVGQKTNDEIIDEITKSQGDLKLADELVAEEEGAAAYEEAVESHIDDDAIDEEQLKELEKTLSEEELLGRTEQADKLKLEANDLFKNGEADKSIEIYTTALTICPTTFPKERAILYANRAAAKIKIDSKQAAIEDCTKAIALSPDYLRAILRRAKLYDDGDKLEEALEDYKRVYELDPGNHEARAAMVRLPPLIDERNEKMKEEMMSKLKDLGNMILKPFGLSTSNFQMQQDPATGSYSVNFNQNQNS